METLTRHPKLRQDGASRWFALETPVAGKREKFYRGDAVELISDPGSVWKIVDFESSLSCVCPVLVAISNGRAEKRVGAVEIRRLHPLVQLALVAE